MQADPDLAGPELAIIVPVFNEVENVGPLSARLEAVLGDVNYEIIFVDDASPDGTADAVRDLSARDRRIRCLERIGRRGLSTAVIEGMLATAAPFAAVIDGDMQHDETVLPAMLAELRSQRADIVVGSRYTAEGSVGSWDESRVRMSRFATAVSQKITGVEVTDPMSGFFMVCTEHVRDRAPFLSGVGFKILLDLLSTPGAPFRVAEVPYTFRTRTFGESKLDSRMLIEFLELLIAKTAGKYVPTKFIMFSIVGSLGIVVHMIVLSLLFQSLGTGFAHAQLGAAMVAMTANFFVNNIFTYRDRMLRGWNMLRGWLSFAAVSTVGMLANVGVAVYLFENTNAFWVASAIAGILVGAAWNFAASALYTWRA